MRILELRLEEWEYGWDDGRPWPWEKKQDPPRSSEESARLLAALEFFDKALASAIGGTGSLRTEDLRGVSPAHEAVNEARALTLLRFGVRIVGLENEPDEEEGT